jgi:hypothetical protein
MVMLMNFSNIRGFKLKIMFLVLILVLNCTSVDPVKATLSISMCSDMAAPAVGPYPGRILTTPAGIPA